MIQMVKTKVGNEKEPEERIALVIENADNIADLAAYRKALMNIAKSVLITDELVPYQCDDLYWILQLADFISSSFEQQCVKKGGTI